MNLKDQIAKIVVNQYDVNNKMAGPDWVLRAQTGAIDYVECIMDESAELRRCAVPFKFWDPSEFPLDLQNAKMEVVDIFHFAISLEIAGWVNVPRENEGVLSEDAKNTYLQEVAGEIFRGFEEYRQDSEGLDIEGLDPLLTIKGALRSFNAYLLAMESIDWSLFASLVAAVDLTPDSLFSIYLAKAELNKFRTSKRASDGRYAKVWANGKEDNANMMDWMSGLAGYTPTSEEVSSWLHANYQIGA